MMTLFFILEYLFENNSKHFGEWVWPCARGRFLQSAAIKLFDQAKSWKS